MKKLFLILFFPVLCFSQRNDTFQKPMFGKRINWKFINGKRLEVAFLLNERGGLDVWDYSGNNRDGTIINATVGSEWRVGDHGFSVDLDGINDYLDFGTDQIIDSNEPFTICIGFTLDAFTDTFPGLLNLFTDVSAQREWILFASTANAAFRPFSFGHAGSVFFRAQVTRDFSADMLLGFRQIVIIYNGQGAGTLTNYTFYYEGVSEALEASSTFNNTPDENNIGRTGDTNFWDGMIDYVYVFLSEFDENDVQRIYGNPYWFWGEDRLVAAAVAAAVRRRFPIIMDE